VKLDERVNIDFGLAFVESPDRDEGTIPAKDTNFDDGVTRDEFDVTVNEVLEFDVEPCKRKKGDSKPSLR
jgi:hypothetical protein